MEKIRILTLKEILVNNLNIILLCFWSPCLFGQVKTNKEIYDFIEAHYDQCLSSNIVIDDNMTLSSLLPTLNDTSLIVMNMRKYISKNELQNVLNKLIQINNTYWKPYFYCRDEYKTNNDEKFPVSISQPIIYQNGEQAAVIGYRLIKGYQTIHFLSRKKGYWELLSEINCGIYLNKHK